MREEIILNLKELADLCKSELSVDAHSYSVETSKWKLKVTLDTDKWVGLEFDLLGENKDKLTYSFDTDSYNLEINQELADGIMQDISSFIEVLTSNSIRVGSFKGGEAMLIPESDGYVLVKKGWFFISTKNYDSKSAATKFGNFKSLLVVDT